MHVTCVTCVQVSLVLGEGVGVSLINSLPEELVFVTLSGMRVRVLHEYCHSQWDKGTCTA